jgi:hypothetical protein
MKLLILIGISIAVYVLIVKPLFLRAPKEQSTTNKVLENIFEAYNHAQTQKQQQQPHQPQADNSRKPRRTANDDDGEYIEYEEIK